MSKKNPPLVIKVPKETLVKSLPKTVNIPLYIKIK